MPSFQKLMHGALERIAKRQGEIDELQKLASRRIELEGAANSLFANPDVAPQGPLTLLHGSPFKFDRFDFENNMLKGEGAMAYGPGGYMTGHAPLAREYAKTLYAKHAGDARVDPSSYHPGIREAATRDPKATAEFLRAKSVSKIPNDYGDGDFRRELTILKNLPPHLREIPNPRAPNVENYDGNVDSWLARSVTSIDGVDAYRSAMADAGLGPEAVDVKVGRGGVAPAEVIRMGRELRKAVKAQSPLDSLRPRIQQRMEFVDTPYGRPMRGRDFYQSPLHDDIDNYGGGYIPGMGKVRQNLNSTFRVATGRPGNSGYVASMTPGGRIDLRDPKFLALMEKDPELARRLYSAQFDASFADMIPYDFPISTMKPEKLGALAQLAEKHSFLDKLTPESRGFDFIEMLRKAAGKPIDQVRALKEAGFPGTFFLRGGRRNGLPDKIDPQDFNFVIHDQDKLGIPDVEKFATGGQV